MVRPFLFAALLAVLTSVHAQNKHVHGEGRLDVVIEPGMLTLHLELPLDAVVGFERAPKTDKEKAVLIDAERVLREAPVLFVPTAAARCVPTKTDVKLPDFKNGEHADIDAAYFYNCANPAALKDIETTIFKPFKRLYRLEVQRSGPIGQGKQRLTPKMPVLSW